jgi:hypothetical protein
LWSSNQTSALGCCIINDSFEIIASPFHCKAECSKVVGFWEREEGTKRQLILLDLFRYSAMIKNSSFQAF